MDKKTKTALIVFGVILIIGIILGIIGSDETETNTTTNTIQNSLPEYILQEENYYTFNMTISDFTKKLNEASTYNLTEIKESDFKYQGDMTAENGVSLKVYLYEQINPANGGKNGKGISLQVAPNGKIAVIRYLSKGGIYTDDVLLQQIISVSINKNKDNSINIIKNATDNIEKTNTSSELHYAYKYYKANEIPMFELFSK